MPASYDYRIDWNADGSFTGTGDDVSQRVRPGLSIRTGRDQTRALSPMAIGSATFGLVNTSRDYYPDNASSPIYPNVLPARPVRFQATLSGVLYGLFRGTIDDYNARPDRDVKLVELSAVDPLAKIREAKATTTLYPSIRTGAAIGAILDAIGWPANARDLDVGATTLRWWSLTKADAWSAIQDLLEAEGAPAIVMADHAGNIVFRDRHHRLWSTLNYNTSFEGTTTSWTATGGTLALNTSQSVQGQNSGQLTPTGSAGTSLLSSEMCALGPGVKVTPTGWLRCAVSRNVQLNVAYYNSSFTLLTTHTFTLAVTANTWTQFLTEFTSPANTAWAAIQPTMTSTPAASHVLLCDDVRLLTASTPVATWRDAGTEPLYSSPMLYDIGWRDIVNDIEWDVEESGPEAELSEIWTTDQTYTIAPGGSLDVTFSTSDPFFDADVGSYTVLSGSAGVIIDVTEGTSATLTITSGTGGTVTDIKVVGHKVTALRTVRVTASDSTSIATYGLKAGPSGAGSACVEDAQAVATLLVATRKVRLPIVQVDFAATSDVRLLQCLSRKISDRVKIIDVAETGLNRDFFIEQIEHTLPQAPQMVGQRSTFGCEAVSTASGLDDPTTVFRFDHPTNGKFGTGRFAT